MKEILLILLLILFVLMAIWLSSHRLSIKTGGGDRLDIVDKLTQEFSRYCLVKDIFEDLLPPEASNKEKYELGAILERFLITLAQGSHDVDPVLKEIYMGDPLMRKMREELNNKRIKIPWATLERMTKKINGWLKEMPKHRVVYNIGDDGTYECKSSECRHKFTYKLPSDRRKALLEVAKREENVDLLILVMLLRYESLLPQGQQWSSPGEFNDKLFKLGVDLEAFSSPKNSGLLMAWWRAGGKPPKFCSLFPDTDSYFGSIGNFYSDEVQSKIAKGAFGGVVVNPPFVENIMKSALEKIQEAIDSNTVFVVVLPSWKDSDAYRIAKENSLVKVELIPKSYYFVSHGDPPKKIVANFGSTVFVISRALEEEDAGKWRGAIIEGFRMK